MRRGKRVRLAKRRMIAQQESVEHGSPRCRVRREPACAAVGTVGSTSVLERLATFGGVPTGQQYEERSPWKNQQLVVLLKGEEGATVEVAFSDAWLVAVSLSTTQLILYTLTVNVGFNLKVYMTYSHPRSTLLHPLLLRTTWLLSSLSGHVQPSTPASTQPRPRANQLRHRQVSSPTDHWCRPPAWTLPRRGRGRSHAFPL